MAASTETTLAMIDMLISTVETRASTSPDMGLDVEQFYKELGKCSYANEMLTHLNLLRSVVSGGNKSSGPVEG